MDDRRRMVDDSVRLAGDVLAACASHVREGREMARWAPHEREALLAACFSHPQGDGIERRKAENLAWHLFRRSGFQPVQPVGDGGFLSERIRADLPGLVRLGAGRYLLRELDPPTDDHMHAPACAAMP